MWSGGRGFDSDNSPTGIPMSSRTLSHAFITGRVRAASALVTAEIGIGAAGLSPMIANAAPSGSQAPAVVRNGSFPANASEEVADLLIGLSGVGSLASACI